MLAQEIYDTVVKHLFAQGKPAFGYYSEEKTVGESGCAYRTGELKCAVGCLIPDDVYRSDMENQSVKNLVNHSEFMVPSYFGGHIPLLNKLQTVHDSSRNWEHDNPEKGWNYANLAEDLLEAAYLFNLMPNILTRELITQIRIPTKEA